MNYAIVTAAGKGTRFGGEKALHALGNRPLLAWALSGFEKNAAIAQILVTTPAGVPDEPYRKMIAAENFKKVRFIHGGETRYNSVRNAFFSLTNPDGIVLIHDAVRPLLSIDLIQRVLDATEKHGAAIPVLPVNETVKEVDAEKIVRTVPRETLFVAQTPQGFQAKILSDAYSKIKGVDVTDESMLVEMAGYPVHVVEGERKNIKITEASDIQLAEYYL